MALRSDEEPASANLLDVEPPGGLALERGVSSVAVEFGGVRDTADEAEKDEEQRLHRVNHFFMPRWFGGRITPVCGV